MVKGGIRGIFKELPCLIRNIGIKSLDFNKKPALKKSWLFYGIFLKIVLVTNHQSSTGL